MSEINNDINKELEENPSESVDCLCDGDNCEKNVCEENVCEERASEEVQVEKKKGGKAKKPLYKEIASWVATICAAVLIALFIRSFVFLIVQVDGSSMLNTLHNDNRLFVWRAGYIFNAPERGDIVICHYPDGKNGEYGERYYVKRVIGLPGDVISISEGMVYINGELLDEPYIADERRSKENMKEYKLGESEYFVMGDNRRNSKDSRYVGPIDQDQIIGKAIYKIYPFDEMGSPE